MTPVRRHVYSILYGHLKPAGRRSLKGIAQVKSRLENGQVRKVAFYPSAAIAIACTVNLLILLTERDLLKVAKLKHSRVIHPR